MARVRVSCLLSVCVLLAIATASHQAQTAVQQTPPQPTFRIGATYVRVDAFVTKDGKPVTDLTADDFELFEDGVRQTIQNFELVNIPSGLPQTALRRDPQSVADMRERAADPRRRVFVLFLDTYHIRQGSSMSSRKAFLRFLDRIVGPDDLIAGMTPEMSPDALAFGSRTESLDSFLNDLWGRRDSLRQDQEEDWIQTCFVPKPGQPDQWPALRERRRTKLTLDAIQALVQRVGALRDERKAIITVTEGWALFRENLKLLENPDPNDRPLHTGPMIVRGPGSRFGTSDSRTGGAPNPGECDKARLELAYMETAQQFRDLPFEANRANASFYVIDPRGLAASDDLLGSPSPTADMAMLKSKLEGMRELADRTDGMAMLYSNDLDKELTRIAQDLSSYYLLGYDSTNGKLDGSYRSLTVKVKRPGVLVRARRGYRAATLPAPGSSNPRNSGSSPTSTTENEIASAIGAITAARADLPVRLRATAVRLVGANGTGGPGEPTSELRVIAELDPKVASSDAWQQGATAHFIVRAEGSATSLSADAALQPRARVLNATIALPNGWSPGAYRVQMRLTAQSHTDALSDSTTVQVGTPGLIAAPAVLRRGPSTGTAYVATADLRFRRADRVRLETPSRVSAAQVRVTIVNQRSQPLNVPIQVSERQESGGTLIVADIALAALAPGGYAIVLTPNSDASGAAAPNPGRSTIIVPFQVIP